MPKRISHTVSELFIVDNSEGEWKVVRYLHDWCQLSKAIDKPAAQPVGGKGTGTYARRATGNTKGWIECLPRPQKRSIRLLNRNDPGQAISYCNQSN
jgi:hypothetical protein